MPPEVAGRHPLPSAEQFAEAAGRAGIGPGTLVVAYDEGMTGGAARLWWLLRHFGHDQAGVLDGGLGIWLGPLAGARGRSSPRCSCRDERTDDVITTDEILERLGDPTTRARRCPARRPLPRRGARASIQSQATSQALSACRCRRDPQLPAELLEADEIACYCGSGVAASALVLALYRAGRHDARLYRGLLE